MFKRKKDKMKEDVILAALAFAFMGILFLADLIRQAADRRRG